MKQELRLIVTQACNYNCYFCHHEGLNGVKKILLDSDDFKYLYAIANKNLGVDTVTITGGEPLLLANIEEIVSNLYSLGCNITIVTNGSLLSQKSDVGKYISKLNISLHSLDKEEYEGIVGKTDVFDTVIENIKMFRALYPEVEINLNCALINKVNLYEGISKLLAFANENKVNVKFIELFPKNSDDYIPLEELHGNLVNTGHELMLEGNRKNKFTNGDGSYVYTTKCLCSRAMDFESPSAFCHNNNDLFIAQDGTIKLCRMRNEEINILDEIKDRDEEGLTKKLKLAFNRLGSGCPYKK